MGALRLLLAISVITAHAGPIFGTTLVPGNYAVETFFIISGFYMSLILSSKYIGTSSIWTFYSNRFLRLYPTYLLMMIGTWVWFFFVWWWLERIPANNWISVYKQLDASFLSGVILANWSMIGLDIPSLFHVAPDGSTHIFHYYGTSAAPDGAIWLGDMRTVGQAWSVGLEIWFYLLAPFLVRLRIRWLVLLACLSACLKAWMELNGILSYFFFPAQLIFFLIGMLVQRVGDKHLKPMKSLTRKNLLVLFVAAITVFYPCWEIIGQRWIYYGLIAAGMPFLFSTTRHNKLDRWIGNLSYPVYLSHMLIISVITVSLKLEKPGVFVLISCLLVSAMIVQWVELPLDKLRQSRIRKTSATAIL